MPNLCIARVVGDVQWQRNISGYTFFPVKDWKLRRNRLSGSIDTFSPTPLPFDVPDVFLRWLLQSDHYEFVPIVVEKSVRFRRDLLPGDSASNNDRKKNAFQSRSNASAETGKRGIAHPEYLFQFLAEFTYEIRVVQLR